MDILSDEPFLKFPSEFQVFFIDRGELIFTDDGGKRSRVTDFRVAGEELVCDILMVLTGETFTDAILHQTGQGRQDADRRVDGLAV